MGGYPLEDPVWKKDGIIQNRHKELQFPNIKKSDKGNYSCTMKNEFGNDTANIYVEVSGGKI